MLLKRVLVNSIKQASKSSLIDVAIIVQLLSSLSCFCATYDTEMLCSVHLIHLVFVTLVLFCLHYALNAMEGAYFGDLFMEPFLGPAFECKLTSGAYNGKVCS